MKKNKKTLKEKFERKKEDYVKVRNSVKMEKKAIFHFIVRFLCSVIFIPFTIYFTVNLVAYGLMDYCILNDIGSLLIIVDTLYKVFNVLFWFVCFVLIFIYNYYMNIKAIGYSIVLKHNTMRRINPGVCPRCKSIIYNDVYMSKERVLDHYEKEIITETDWSGWRPKTREVYESTRPVYTTQDVEKNYQRCSNDGCGYEWKFKRVFADMPTVLWRLYTLEFPSKNNLSIEEISLGIKPFPDMYFIFKKSSRIKGFLSVIIVVFLVLLYIFNIDSRYQLTEQDIYGWLCFLCAFVLFSGAFQIYIHKQFKIKNCKGKKKCEEGISEEGAELLLKALAQVNCMCEKQDGKKLKRK